MTALVLSAGTGCGPQGTPPSAAPVSARASVPGEPTRPLTGLPTVQVWLGTNQMTAEVVRTMEEIHTGMMFRTSIGEDQGMLFVFGRPHRASFWMKNVSVPLSCAYLDPDGRILEIHDLEPGEETPVYARSSRVQFVLETGRGWFERRRVQPGMLVRTEAGSLAQTFLGETERH